MIFAAFHLLLPGRESLLRADPRLAWPCLLIEHLYNHILNQCGVGHYVLKYKHWKILTFVLPNFLLKH